MGLDGSDDAENFLAGFGDGLTFGLTRWIRGKLGIDGVNTGSGVYSAGGGAGKVVLVLATLGAGGEAEAAELFENQFPEMLADELDAAEAAGATVVRAGGAGFDAAVNEGTIKFVVTESGDLMAVGHTVNGVEISHAVISGGDAVLTAGEADVAGSAGNYVGLRIANWSGHFTPSEASLSIARELFARIGITFP